MSAMTVGGEYSRSVIVAAASAPGQSRPGSVPSVAYVARLALVENRQPAMSSIGPIGFAGTCQEHGADDGERQDDPEKDQVGGDVHIGIDQRRHAERADRDTDENPRDDLSHQSARSARRSHTPRVMGANEPPTVAVRSAS